MLQDQMKIKIAMNKSIMLLKLDIIIDVFLLDLVLSLLTFREYGLIGRERLLASMVAGIAPNILRII